MPQDIDVLVIGDVDPDDVYESINPVEAVVGRPINPVLRTTDEWAQASGFARSVRSGDTIELIARP